MRRGAAFVFVFVASPGVALASCGARSELGVDIRGAERESGPEAAEPVDAPDVDAGQPDAFDAGPDVAMPVDAPALKDAPVCPTGLTAYLISATGDLYTFDPTTLATHLLGAPRCPVSLTPFTLTASSTGTVYVMYEDWNIYAVDPTTLACARTPYVPHQLSLGVDDTFTVAPDVDGGESLYVYGQKRSGQTVLDVTDLSTFVLTEVGPVTPEPPQFPLDVRADPFGRIFGLGQGGLFAEIDRRTAAVVALDDTTFTGADWALLTYNDGIYFFGSGEVSKYDRATKTLTALGNVGIGVVGASAAPCLH